MTETRALSRYDGPRTTEELREYALLLAFDTNPEGQYKRNDALPVAFRGNPGAVAFAVEYGKALDVSPITALIGIHIVEGKPTASAGLISALVRRAGHRIRTWTEGTIAAGDLKGITTIVREDDPDFEYRVEWTLERAVRAGLCQLVRTETGWTVTARGRSGKPGAWETYTEGMVKARSITECSRDAAEDAILGVHYTPEELGVEVDETGEPVYTVTTVPTNDAPSRTEPAPTPAPMPVEDVTGEMADRIRDLILDSTATEELSALWLGPIIGASEARAKGITVGDADGAEVAIFDLFQQMGQAINAGTVAELRARFGLVPVVDHADDPAPGDGDEGDGTANPAATDPPKGPSEPSSGAAAPEATAPPASSQGPETFVTGPKAEPPHLRTLNLTADGMTADQRAELLGYVKLWSLAPSTSEEDAAKVCSAIATGIIGGLVSLPGPDVVDLLRNAQNEVGREQEVAAEEARAEQRAEAAAVAKPPGPDSSGGRKAAAQEAARAAAAEARDHAPARD